MAIDDDVKITINLNKLVDIRARLLTQNEPKTSESLIDYSHAIATGEYLDGNDVDRIASKLRDTLTWDALYSMVDEAVLEYLDLNETHYGEIQPEPGREAYLNEIEKNKKQFKMVKLESPSWTIDVPVRK